MRCKTCGGEFPTSWHRTRRACWSWLYRVLRPVVVLFAIFGLCVFGTVLGWW